MDEVLRNYELVINKMRRALRQKLEDDNTPEEWSHIENQIGMFSYTGLDRTMVTFEKRDPCLSLAFGTGEHPRLERKQC